jgi:hypothetical protein
MARSELARGAAAASAAMLLRVALAAQSPPAPPAPARCRVEGRATSGATPLPGVSIVVRAAGALKAATSSDLDGRFTIFFAPGATFTLSADLTGFTHAERVVSFAMPPCDQTVDFDLRLSPRDVGATSERAGGTPSAHGRTATAAPERAGRSETTERSEGGAARGRAGGRFQPLNVQADASGANALDVSPAQAAEEVTALLPPGFTLQSAQADAIAINGSGDAASLDRRLMNDRARMINLAELDPATGQFAEGFGPQAFGGGPGGPPGGLGGPGGPGGFGGRGGSGRGFPLGGRGARGQRPYQGSATYTFGGSVLDSPPYQLNPSVPATQPVFAQNSFGGTFGGPLKIPGVYGDKNRRTSFQVNYTGNRSNNVFDQYATVPTDAERAGDFSGSPDALIDPSTGQPFPGNVIPASRISPAATTLLQFVPAPNLPGATQNFHVSTTTYSSSEAVSLRVIQNLSKTVPPAPNGRGGAGRGLGGSGGSGGFGGGRGGMFGRAPGGTNVVLTGQLQYRRTDQQTPSVFPDLGSRTTGTSLAAPVNLIVRHGRSIQNLSLNVAHATTRTGSAFANAENVGALAGIHYPPGVSSNPLNWGVPNLSFSSGFTAVTSTPASARSDDRLTLSYTWMHPTPKHQLRMGGDYRLTRSTADVNANARGTFVFTGLYTSNGVPAPGADFADFLLGLPQQATLQAGGTSALRQHQFDGFVEDNWRPSARLTVNAGLRYELALPFTEANGHMANLDAASGFTAVVPVLPGASGPYTGAFPAGLLNADTNNLGPRLGFAYRLRPSTILRGGYGISYNSSAYASIAREFVAQPPFADTETITGTAEAPLTLAEALLSSPSGVTTNNWGVDKDFALGMIQTWNATLIHNLTQNWMVQAGYTGIKGSDLDILRAPGLGPGGTLVAGAQAFIWESSGGRSQMNGGNLQLRRRLANGVGGGVSYTLARAMDDAPSLGAGQSVVAQNDQNLAAEWGPSNFDRRQQLSGDLYFELPWGPNRRWLTDGGALAAIIGEWSAQVTLTLQSGTPLTARVLGAATDLLRGVNGSLRADDNGGPIQLADPTVDEFFNVTAFSVPPPGQFGDAARNSIVGPGARQLNALFQRDIRLGDTRSLTLQVNAVNLLDTVQWAAIDTNVNSSTFGHVISARPMRTMTIAARVRF